MVVNIIRMLTELDLGGAAHTIALASETQATAMDLDEVSAGVFEKAIENVVFLRAQTGAGMSRLSFAAESMKSQETNMRSALGRIEDVDIAEESANLAKYSISDAGIRCHGGTGKLHQPGSSDATAGITFINLELILPESPNGLAGAIRMISLKITCIKNFSIS